MSYRAPVADILYSLAHVAVSRPQSTRAGSATSISKPPNR